MAQQIGFPIQRTVGVLLVVGGLWHAAAPWVVHYSQFQPMVVSSIAAGAALVLVGAGYLVFRGGAILDWAGGLLGAWVTLAPAVLLADRPFLPMLEASWGGPITLALVAVAALDRHFSAPADRSGGRAASA